MITQTSGSARPVSSRCRANNRSQDRLVLSSWLRLAAFASTPAPEASKPPEAPRHDWAGRSGVNRSGVHAKAAGHQTSSMCRGGTSRLGSVSVRRIVTSLSSASQPLAPASERPGDDGPPSPAICLARCDPIAFLLLPLRVSRCSGPPVEGKWTRGAAFPQGQRVAPTLLEWQQAGRLWAHWDDVPQSGGLAPTSDPSTRSCCGTPPSNFCI